MDRKEFIEVCVTPLYGVIYITAVGFLFYNTLINPTAAAVIKNRLVIITAIGIIMLCPMLVDRNYRAGQMHRASSRWLMIIAYVFTILIVGFGAISWYLSPENGRWEPLTIILGFTVSWITWLQRGWREEDRILAVFDLDDDT